MEALRDEVDLRDAVDPRDEVDPRSVVETVALVCSAVKDSVKDSVNGSSDDTPLSSQLDQLTIAVRKLEKQYLTQQVNVSIAFVSIRTEVTTQAHYVMSKSNCL